MKITRDITSVVIMGETYLIKHRSPKDKTAWAETDLTKQTIVMSPKLDATGFRNTLGHEIAHVVLAKTGLNVFLSADQEEKYCDTLGRALIMLLEENTKE